MKPASQISDTSDNGVQEKYLGCSKGGLPQLGYTGIYVSNSGSLSISQLPCSRHMNLACLNDEVLLTLLSRQPMREPYVCLLLALMVKEEFVAEAVEDEILVYSNYLCIKRQGGCWITKRDFSVECCPDEMQLAKKGSDYVKIDICACAFQNLNYTKAKFVFLKDYTRYLLCGRHVDCLLKQSYATTAEHKQVVLVHPIVRTQAYKLAKRVGSTQ
jgi:hypothetical protein